MYVCKGIHAVMAYISRVINIITVQKKIILNL